MRHFSFLIGVSGMFMMILFSRIRDIVSIDCPVFLDWVSFGRKIVDTVFRWAVGPTIPRRTLKIDHMETIHTTIILSVTFILQHTMICDVGLSVYALSAFTGHFSFTALTRPNALLAFLISLHHTDDFGSHVPAALF